MRAGHESVRQCGRHAAPFRVERRAQDARCTAVRAHTHAVGCAARRSHVAALNADACKHKLGNIQTFKRARSASTARGVEFDPESKVPYPSCASRLQPCVCVYVCVRVCEPCVCVCRVCRVCVCGVCVHVRRLVR